MQTIRKKKKNPAGSSIKKRSNLHLSKRYPSAPSGIILIADICSFFELAGTRQRDVMQRLWEFLHANQTIKRYTPIVNILGDGVMIAFPQDRHVLASHDQVMDFVTDLLEAMASIDAQVAVGINEGNFERSDFAGQVQAFGSGINECQKLARLASKDIVVVSESFISTWIIQQGYYRVASRFYPSDRPFSLPQKKQPELKFRVYKKAGQERLLLPNRIMFGQMVDDEIRQSLVAIEELFVAQLHILNPTLTRGVLSPRVSLLAPTVMADGSRFLWSTALRYHHSARAVTTNRTTYSLEGSGQGFAARAYITNSTQIVTCLPDYERDSKGYVSLLDSIGLSAEFVKDFGRKARAFIAFPFAFGTSDPVGSKTEFRGVICIDTMHPLDGMKPAKLERVVAEISRQFAKTIALLWAHRLQHLTLS